MKKFAAFFLAGASALAAASPTGLNQIPTTDLVPLNNLILGIQNGNTSFSYPSFLSTPVFSGQSQIGLMPWLEAGVDYSQTPDNNYETMVFNAKALLLAETDYIPNAAVGVMNVTHGQLPTYYVTISKTLNYEQEEEERFRAHHRRNRKLLGRRVHIGVMADELGNPHPFAGTDIQLNETVVFQADWIQGHGNAASCGVAYVMPDQRTVLNPAILFTNDTHQFGLQLNLSHQFSL